MATSTLGMQRLGVRSDRLDLGGKLIAVAGIAVLVYGLVFLVLNFTVFTEIGFSPSQVGGDAAGIQGYSPALYRYVSHLQVNIAGFIVATGLMLTCLAWFGVRRGQLWALGAALGSYLTGLLIALPIHYAYGLATLVHLGPFYLVTLLIVVGSAIAYSGMPKSAGADS